MRVMTASHAGSQQSSTSDSQFLLAAVEFTFHLGMFNKDLAMSVYLYWPMQHFDLMWLRFQKERLLDYHLFKVKEPFSVSPSEKDYLNPSRYISYFIPDSKWAFVVTENRCNYKSSYTDQGFLLVHREKA